MSGEPLPATRPRESSVFKTDDRRGLNPSRESTRSAGWRPMRQGLRPTDLASAHSWSIGGPEVAVLHRPQRRILELRSHRSLLGYQ